MKIGSHISIRSGYLGAAKVAIALGAGAFQYFPKNPRSLNVKSFDRADAEKCKAFCEQHQLLSIAHTPYPTNLCVIDPELYKATVASVRNDLEIAEACGSIGVVVHFGHYKEEATDPLRGYQVMIQMLNEILDGWTGSSLVLLENNAGQGTRMGTTMEELCQVHSLIAAPEKVGFCLDTCHAFASRLWEKNNWPEVAARARELGYFKHLRAIHLNDSIYPSGSYRDRHAGFGLGEIGAEALTTLLRTPEFAALPIILETPTPAGGSHQAQIEMVQKLVTS